MVESSLLASMPRSLEKSLTKGLIVAGIGGKEARRIISHDLRYSSNDLLFDEAFLDE